MHGQDVPVRAAIEKVPGLSGHADRSGLLRWLEPLAPPKQTFLVHGEVPARRASRPRPPRTQRLERHDPRSAAS